ncbi:MAG TPA: ATP-binding protein [Polyangiaceae bacterium]|nr:ATP-binding protein [Polyangiaceae bacterium]
MTDPLPKQITARGALRAELVSAAWEIFSAMLFVSAVLPSVRGPVLPPAIFLVGLVVSAILARPLAKLGDRGLFVAAAARVVFWSVSILPIPAKNDPRAWIAILTFGLMAAAMRRAIYRREIGPVPLDARNTGDALSTFLRRRFGESAMLAGILGGHLLLLFSVAFLRAESKVVFRGWWQFLPVLAVSATVVYTIAMRRLTANVARALEAGPNAAPESLVGAARELRRLPTILSTINFALWLACTTSGIFYFRSGPVPFTNADLVMQLGYTLLFSWGVAFYQRGWDRDAASQVERLLLRWAKTDERAANLPAPDYARLPIRDRMLRDFGWPLVFAAMLMLLSSLGLYRALEGTATLGEDDAPMLALVAAFIMLVIAVGGVIARVARELSRPIGRMTEAAEVVARGELGQAVPPIDGPSEIARLAASVERMRERLAGTIAELEDERATLESKVDARTSELKKALRELGEAQAALVHGERLATIGELVAGVAHEINNPLNAVAGSAEPLEQVVVDVRAMLDAYRAAEVDLPAARRKELDALRKKLDLDASLDDLVGISSVVKRATERTVRIVQNLRNFARVTGEAVPTDLHAGLEETLVLLGPRLRQSCIQLTKTYGELPPVTCRAGEINQVFMNLLVNAIQALETSTAEDGVKELRIMTRTHAGMAEIAIIDNGPGVPQDLRERIFDPFFTTKPRGQGTGLGLSISSDIVRKHGGTLNVERPDAGGAKMVVRLPLAAEARRERTTGKGARL